MYPKKYMFVKKGFKKSRNYASIWSFTGLCKKRNEHLFSQIFLRWNTIHRGECYTEVNEVTKKFHNDLWCFARHSKYLYVFHLDNTNQSKVTKTVTIISNFLSIHFVLQNFGLLFIRFFFKHANFRIVLKAFLSSFDWLVLSREQFSQPCQFLSAISIIFIISKQLEIFC